MSLRGGGGGGQELILGYNNGKQADSHTFFILYIEIEQTHG